MADPGSLPPPAVRTLGPEDTLGLQILPGLRLRLGPLFERPVYGTEPE